MPRHSDEYDNQLECELAQQRPVTRHVPTEPRRLFAHAFRYNAGKGRQANVCFPPIEDTRTMRRLGAEWPSNTHDVTRRRMPNRRVPHQVDHH